MTEYVRGTLPWKDGKRKVRDGYTDLAVAVIKTAVDDYIKVLKLLNDDGISDSSRIKAEDEKRQLERFFHSDHYWLFAGFLETEIDPDVIIRQCGLRAMEKGKSRKKSEAGKNAGSVKKQIRKKTGNTINTRPQKAERKQNEAGKIIIGGYGGA